MKRREFIAMLGCVATSRFVVAAPTLWAGTAGAQEARKVHRIGYLSGGTAVSRGPFLVAFMRGLSELGYVEGQSFVIERRFAEGRFERLPELARDLLAWKPDVLLVSTTPANAAARSATATVPIVMVAVADPVGAGLIRSLARPGGNVTGVTNIGAELAGKRLEILKEMVPGAARIAVLINPDDPNAKLQLDQAGLAARNLAVELAPILHVRGADDLARAFDAARAGRATAALRMIDPLSTALREPTVSLAAEHRMPVFYPFREDVTAGGLISYGTSLPDQYRQSAMFVHKILSGASPADLPVEQPTRFELAVNLKTAKALDLAIPTSILLRADEVIE